MNFTLLVVVLLTAIARGYCYRIVKSDITPFVQSTEDGSVRVWYPYPW